MANDFLSFRAKREIFPMDRSEKIRFLPAVEMTDATFYFFVSFVLFVVKKHKE